jgi:hypothetical protein
MKTWIWQLRVWFRRLWLSKAQIAHEEEYRAYFSDKLLKHQAKTLDLYDPKFRARIPTNPETLKQIKIFPK